MKCPVCGKEEFSYAESKPYFIAPWFNFAFLIAILIINTSFNFVAYGAIPFTGSMSSIDKEFRAPTLYWVMSLLVFVLCIVYNIIIIKFRPKPRTIATCQQCGKVIRSKEFDKIYFD